MPDKERSDSGDLLAEHEEAGGADPTPEPVTDPGDPSYVEPYGAATPVEG